MAKKKDASPGSADASVLRRSSRGKKLVEVPDLPKFKSTKEKTANNSKQISENVHEDKKTEKQDPDGGKRKRFTAIRYKALFKPQRIRIESDNGEGPEEEDRPPEANTSKNEDLDKELKTQNSVRVQGAPEKNNKAFLDGRVMDLNQVEHGDCPTKLLNGNSVGSGDMEEKIGGNISPSNRNIANRDSQMFHTSSHRIEHDLENQQKLDTCHKVTGICKAGGVMGNIEHNNVSSNMQSSKFVEFWVPVQISNVQLEQYCATLLSNAMALRSSSKNDTLGALRDILFANRKCCNHPYLVDPKLQESLIKDKERSMILDIGIKASGKLQFLDHILPELQKRQLRVLILFQPTIGTLNGFASLGAILADYVHQRFGQNSYEHVDGVGNISSKKQAAINTFNKDMSRFIFLLESRSCHPSIKLSSVGVIIIFDSDLNPSNDLKSLQKISIDSESEQITIFRLYSSSTLEEKILKLAENNMAIDIRSQNLRCNYDALLTWGASDLFDKLAKFHSQNVLNIASEGSLLKDVVVEFLYIISHKCKSNDATSKAIIIQVQNCEIYVKSIPLHCEIKTHLPDGDQPYIFWKKLLEGRFPTWKFVSESTPRQRKRPHYFLDSPPKEKSGVDGGVKTRRKTVNNSTIEPAQLKTLTEGETGGVIEGVPVANDESQSSSGDQFWSTGISNEINLLDLLKPTVSELCNILKFSEDVKITVERFLEFVLKNYKVSKEHTSALQAFMISLCWIGSSLAKSKIDRSESFTLAKRHFDFSCMEEEADSVYKKLKPVKETFLQQTHILDCLKNNLPSPEGNKLEIKRHPHIPNAVASENHESIESVSIKGEEAFVKSNGEWDEKRASLENDYRMDRYFIHALYSSNPSIRSEKLKILEREFANKLVEHERQGKIHREEIKATMLETERQVAADREFSLHGSQYEAQVLHSGNPENVIEAQSNDEAACEEGDKLKRLERDFANNLEEHERLGEIHLEEQERMLAAQREVAVDSEFFLHGPQHETQVMHSGNPVNLTEAKSHDGPVCEGANDVESTGSHTSEKEMVDTTVLSEQIGEVPAQQLGDDMEVDVAEKVDPSHENTKGDTCSHDVPHAIEDHNETGEKDMAPHGDSGDTGMPGGNYNKENGEDETLGLDTSLIVKDHSETFPEVECLEMGTPAGTHVEDHNETDVNNKMTHVDSGDMEMPAGNYSKENDEHETLGLDTSHIVKDHPETVDVAPEVECPEMGTPAGTHAVEDHNETDVNNMMPHVNSGDMEIPVGNYNKENDGDGTLGLDTSHTVEDSRETFDDVAPEVECAEMGTPADICDKEKAKNGEITPDVDDNHNETSPNNVLPHLESAEMGMPAGTCDKENAENDEINPDTPDVGDHHDTSPNDVLLHAESVEMATRAANEENAEDIIIRPDALHATKDHNNSFGSTSINPVCATIAQDKTPSVQPISSPASDHLGPIIPEIQNELLQLPDSGVRDDEMNADQLDQLIPDDGPDFPVAENLSDVLPPSGPLLEPICEEPTLTLPQSGENLEENLAAAETPHEEHQPCLATSVAPAPVVNALNMFDNLINQVSSQMPYQTDPLQAEVERLCTVKNNVTKFYQDTKQRLDSECKKEIEEMVALIKLKYETKHIEADAAYNSKKMELETNIDRVAMNKILADAFRSKCRDLTPSGHPHMQQAPQAGLMQQLHRLSVSPTTRHSQAAPSSPGQSSGSQQSPQPSPSLPQPSPLQQPQTRPMQPLQIVHQPAALFSSRPQLSRLPPMVNQVTSSTPPTTSRQLPTRPPPTVKQIIPSTTPTTSRPRPTVNPITPSSTPATSKSPPGSNTINPSTFPNKSPPSIAQIDMSAANLRISTETRGPSPHMRPLVSSESRAPALHMRSLVSNEPRAPAPHLRSLPSSEYRAPAPHIRPFRSAPSVSLDTGPHWRMMPSQHVTCGPSQTPVIPPPSTSSPQSLTPLPSRPFIVPQPPPAEPSTVPLSPPSEQTPLLPSFDNLNGVVDNAPRLVNVMTSQPDARSQVDMVDLTEFLQEGTAQPSSAHDLVCLSDDD